MITQVEKARLFTRLHSKGNPLILFNIWDAGSARAVQEAGAKAVATGSWSVASAHGYADGEQLPFELVLANLQRIIASVNVPVSLDLEGGYGKSPVELQENVAQVIEAGAVGINFEDQIIGSDGLHATDTQCERIAAIRSATEDASVPLFINARTDLFLQTDPAEHNTALVEAAIERAKYYAAAGASGFFVPGLANAEHIRTLCEHSSLPLNIMIVPDAPSVHELAALGVARISHGPGPYRVAMDTLKATAVSLR